MTARGLRRFRRSVKWPAASFAKLERPSAIPWMAPSHIGPAPMAARNAGSTAVAVSWLQSLKRLVRPTPSTVRFSQDCSSGASGMGRQFIVESSKLKVRSSADSDLPEIQNREGRSVPERQLRRHAPNLFLGRAVEDDADFFESDEAAFHHFVQVGENSFDALDGFDDFKNDGEVLRQAQQLVGVIAA